MLYKTVTDTLHDLKNLLIQLSDEDYNQPIIELSNSTIGQHTRHIIELFQCLLSQYENGEICYDKRPRNLNIEVQTNFAIEKIDEIINNIKKPNKNLTLINCFQNQKISIETNYNRELLYNLEHCIHHQALIKVPVITLNCATINENFGVAPSTIDYRQKCVQ